MDRAVLLTVLYADLFDYPLTHDELYERLIGKSSSREAFAHALARLMGPYLSATDGYVTWRGREALIAVREHRHRVARPLWQTARRYARWLARVPFVQMVAISGSLAVRNAQAQSDIDLFCITAPNRLWLARACIVPLSKLTARLPRFFPLYLCPNYILSRSALGVEDHNLFTAHEVAQAVPLWDHSAYHPFLHANRWVRDFLPHTRFETPQPVQPSPRRPWLTRGLERLVQGRLGDVLDRLVYRCFTAFYRKRAERAGWAWARLAPAYQRNRYTVPEGGYARVIHRLFTHRVRERLGALIPASDLDRLFAFTHEAPAHSIYDWDGLFADEYGAAALDGLHQQKNE